MRPAVTAIVAVSVWTTACFAAEDAAVSVLAPKVNAVPTGRHVVQDVTLSTSANAYTLRYDAIELADKPGRIGFAMWAPTLGYTPLGIIGPDGALWYNQGFFIWTLDDLNIQDYQASFRVVRDYGPDAMVEYVWDTPKAKVIARFAVTSGSDKLIFFGRYEPKEEVKEVKLRLMAYPATFTKPWNRTLTTATRTLTTGATDIDLEKEKWLLLEDVTPDRPASGSAGLLLGDTSAFSKVSVDSIGGYAEYVNLTLSPERREFVLGLYELPSAPEYKATREYFGRLGDSESAALAQVVLADLDRPLPPLPVDAERLAQIEKSEAQLMDRPAEIWRPDPSPLPFPWAAAIPGEPVRVGLLCPRFIAYETMELGRRLEMDLRRLYFDGSGAMTAADYWPYRGTTGIGPLPAGVAMRHAMGICQDPTRDVIMVCKINGDTLGPRLRGAILDAVKGGKGLLLTGGSGMLKGWPAELTATPDDSLLSQTLSALPWQDIAGLRPGEKGRTADRPFRAWRYGQGRVVLQDVALGTYSSLVPRNEDTEGLDGATDRSLALTGQALLAAAGRTLPCSVTMAPPETPPIVAMSGVLPVGISGAFTDALVRVQDDHDNVLALGSQNPAAEGQRVSLPPLPGGRRYFVDVAVRNADGACVGYGGTVVDLTGAPRIADVRLTPANVVHGEAPPMVDLIQGGILQCEAKLLPGVESAWPQFRWEVKDCFGRVLAKTETRAEQTAEGFVGRAEVSLPRPVTVCHQLDVAAVQGDRVVGVYTQPFTVPLPYSYDDFTLLMWSYPGGEPVVRREDRLCYEMGSDMMDLCHMRGFTDAGAARQYALSSRSGQRVVPYVSRIALDDQEPHRLTPGPFDPQFIERERASMQVASRQAVPYRPAAYTLGDENYLSRGRVEVDDSPETMVEFREWLQERYGTIAALNEAWDSTYATFDEITTPMWIEEATAEQSSYAAWFDHRIFMDTAFARCHELFADVIRAEDPGAKVGWDGFLGYHWQAGYDFEKLTANLELNQVYTVDFPQGEIVASLKRPDALSGEWGNSVADREDGFSAIPWHNLFKGHNSCWWWTSWGCDYIPFNPDLSVSRMGEWYFRAGEEVRSGPGKALLHARRDDSQVAILYSQTDMFAARLAGKITPGAAYCDGAWLAGHKALINGLNDLGVGFRHIGAGRLEADPECLKPYRVLFLPLATCLSEKQVAAIREFVSGGGQVIADGRVGLLSGNGVIYEQRPLDDVFGVTSPAGQAAFAANSQPVALAREGVTINTHLLEPGLKAADGTPVITPDGTQLLVQHAFAKGRAALLNVPFALVEGVREEPAGAAARGFLRALLEQSAVRPFAELSTPEGPARCIKQSMFTDDGVQYLCLEQDILRRGIPQQALTVRIPQAAVVYDVRAGQQVGDGPTDTWTTTIDRGTPRLYALMGSKVSTVTAEVAATAKTGEAVPVSVEVSTDTGRPGFHVVHLSVFPPGSDRQHRQYSQNLACPGGQGKTDIPFALNDAPGTWRLVLRDVASGVKAEKSVELRG